MARPKKETLEHRQAFDLYLSMGADRSLAKVANKFGKSEVAVENWSKAFSWQTRIDEAEKRIADKTSAKLEESLASFDANTIKIADAVIELFVQNLRDAYDEEGNLAPNGFRPSAKDARLFIDLKRSLMAKMGVQMPEGSGEVLDAGAVEELGVEKIERIILERVTRLSKARGGGNP